MKSDSYLVLARKYRPQNFETLVGQEPIATTLKNAITLDRVAHAYLFTGPRGVGKTSTARIFAKALNCKTGPTPNPCGTCQNCQEIEMAKSLDVLEIDGASNRGIDEIRALRENIKFHPASSRYKIYIIDEVHQITADAFNALLKTLEEPPAHVKFIFATTSVSKVPTTILSRCQRFDFKRIATIQIADTLKEICKKEKIKVEDDALFLIAKIADGGLRDSQSILDQIAASSNGEKITTTLVTELLGSLQEDRLVELFSYLAKKDTKSTVLFLNDFLKEGLDPSIFMEKFLEHVRNLLFVKVSDKLLDLVDSTESYKKTLLETKDNFSKEDLFYFFSVMSHTLNLTKRFDSKRVAVEIALIKLAERQPLEELSKILASLKELKYSEKKTENVSRAVTQNVVTPQPSLYKAAPKVSSRQKEEPDDVIEDLEEASVDEILPRQTQADDVPLESVWNALIGALKMEKISVASYLSEGEPIGFQNGIAKISFPEGLSFHRETLESPENKQLIEKHLSGLLGKAARIEFELIKELGIKNNSSNNFNQATPPAETVADPQSSEFVKNAMNIFGGRIIGQ